MQNSETGVASASLLRPRSTFLWFAAWIALVYAALLKTVGMDMALMYLGSGKNYAEVLASVRNLEHNPYEPRTRIFYFGDSTIAYLDKDEAAPVFLQRELNKIYGEDAVEVVQWAFNGAAMFHYYCLMCKAQEYSPSLLIIPINYRTFGSLWHEQTRLNEQRRIAASELIAFAPLIEKAEEQFTGISELEGIGLWDKVSAKFKFFEIYYFQGTKLWLKDATHRFLFRTSPVRDKIEEANEKTRRETDDMVRMVSQIEFSTELFDKIYPMQIEKDSLQLLSYESLAKTLARHDIPFLFYLTPLNIEQLKAYKAFDPSLFARNVETFREISVRNGGRFSDLSALLDSEDFTRLEHYTPEGAKKVARALRFEIEHILAPGKHRRLSP